jgi:predicted Fe-Mo cluster-binding NifX family protein
MRVPKVRKTRKVAISSSNRGARDGRCSLVLERFRTFTVVELEDGEVKNVEVARNSGYQSGDCTGMMGIPKRKGADYILVGVMGRIGNPPILHA